jgi:hypothetical protein
MIVKLAVHYEQQRTNKLDNNNGLLYGIYYYDVPKEDLDTDNMFNYDIVHVKWYKTKLERNKNLN